MGFGAIAYGEGAGTRSSKGMDHQIRLDQKSAATAINLLTMDD